MHDRKHIKKGINGKMFSFSNPIERVGDEYWTFDICGGHASAKGTYHYHCEPRCLINNVVSISVYLNIRNLFIFDIFH